MNNEDHMQKQDVVAPLQPVPVDDAHLRRVMRICRFYGALLTAAIGSLVIAGLSWALDFNGLAIGFGAVAVLAMGVFLAIEPIYSLELYRTNQELENEDREE